MSIKKTIIFIIIVTASAFSQVTVSNVFVKAGEVRNYQENGNNKYAFSLEAGIGGGLLENTIYWDAGFSYWDDGINSSNNIPDSKSISNTCYIVGFNIGYRLINLFDSAVSVSANAGVVYNIKNNSDALSGDKINTSYYFQPRVGLELNYRLNNGLFFTGNIGSFIGVSRENPGREVFAAGAGYYFN
jgi:hypothetical protein